jgi:hypothetical protein
MSRPITFTVRVVLAYEFAGLRAAEVALPLKMINARGKISHTSLSPGQDMPGGGRWHVVWEKAGDHAIKQFINKSTFFLT